MRKAQVWAVFDQQLDNPGIVSGYIHGPGFDRGSHPCMEILDGKRHAREVSKFENSGQRSTYATSSVHSASASVNPQCEIGFPQERTARAGPQEKESLDGLTFPVRKTPNLLQVERSKL